MLNEQTQNKLFDKIIKILDNPIYQFKDIANPVLDLDYVKQEKPEDEGKVFETLGYFQPAKDGNVFLCPDLIQKRPEAQLLAEIVYVHEVAHYLHYHMRKANGKGFGFTNDKEIRLQIVESFAQLITHKVCLEESAMHYKRFEELKEGQSNEYTLYYKTDNPYTSYSKETLLETFINLDIELNYNLNQYLFRVREKEIKNLNSIKEGSLNTDTLFSSFTDDSIFKQPVPFIY